MATLEVIYDGKDITNRDDWDLIIELLAAILQAILPPPLSRMNAIYKQDGHDLKIYCDGNTVATPLSPEQITEIMGYCVDVLELCGAETETLLDFEIDYDYSD